MVLKVIWLCNTLYIVRNISIKVAPIKSELYHVRTFFHENDTNLGCGDETPFTGINAKNSARRRTIVGRRENVNRARRVKM